MLPLEIKVKEGKYLYLRWNDQTEDVIKIANLRWFCPCALCGAEREERGAKYIPLYSDDELKIKAINPVGSYAVSIEWKDEHSTGIYDFAYLKKLSKQKELI